MNEMKAIGLMSGTSLDGIDVACCEFHFQQEWSFTIQNAITYSYNEEWSQALKHAHLLNALDFITLHKDYGHYLGLVVKNHIQETGFYPDIIASHGHTIFHNPDAGLTFQLGDGASLAAEAGFPVVSDFRTGDVALGGQGAPLVPVGDKLLFGNFTSCLNLGGFSNISYDRQGKRIAFDVSPCNMALNKLAMKAGYSYDDQGKLAGSGTLIPGLFDQLNQLEYYSSAPPKSLGREWFEDAFWPLINHELYTIPDLLRTITEHIAYQVALSLGCFNGGSLMITGGGAHNSFLTDRIKKMVPLEVMVPAKNIIDFKEALIFAFLGILRFRNEINVLSSVTGSGIDHIAGAVYL